MIQALPLKGGRIVIAHTDDGRYVDIETYENLDWVDIHRQLDAADSDSAREYLEALKLLNASTYGQSSVPPSPFPSLADIVKKPAPEPMYRNGIVNRHNRRKAAKLNRRK